MWRPRGEHWWDPKQPGQGALWQIWILLGEECYSALVAFPVPVDMRALRALKRSPLDLDLYAWVCYRAFMIVQKKQPPQFMAWSVLMRQLGTDYSDPMDFKKYASAALRKIAILYPGLTIGRAKGGSPFGWEQNRARRKGFSVDFAGNLARNITSARWFVPPYNAIHLH